MTGLANIDEFEIVHSDVHCSIGTVRNVALVVWRVETPLKNVRVLAAELQRLRAKNSRIRLGLVQVLEAGIKPLESDVRSEFGKMLQSGRDYISCSSVVFEGEGFRAAAIRGVVTGLAIFSRTAFPHTVFAKVEAAVDWQLAHLRVDAPGLSTELLLECVSRLRQCEPKVTRETA